MKKFYLIIITLKICSFCFCKDSKPDKNDLEYSFIDALKNEQFGNLENSAFLLKSCIIYDSTCGACYYELSRILRAIGDYRNALLYSKKATNIDIKNYWYIKNLIEIQIIDQEYKGAIENLENLIYKGVAKIEDKVNYAKVLILLNKGKKAINILNEIENINGISETISMIKYKYYLNIKKFKKAEKEIKKLLEYNDDKIELYGIMAELYAIQMDDKNALDYYMKLLKLDNNNIAGLTSLGRFYCSRKDTNKTKEYFNKIFLNDKISKENKIDAFNDFTKNSNDSFIMKSYLKIIINILISNDKNNTQLLEYYLTYLDKLNEYNKAISICKRLNNLRPENRAYWERTLYYENALGKYSEITEIIDSISSKFSESPFIMLMGGIAYYQTKNLMRAIDFLKKGYILKSKNEFINEQYLVYLSEIYYKLGNKDSAFHYFEIATSSEKKNLIIMNNYAYYLAENNRKLEKAHNLSLYTIQIEPKNATFLDTYAWILYKQKMYKSALKYIKLAYKYNSDKNNEIVIHYGDICFCNEKISMARQKWNESLKMGADSVIIEKKLNEFKCE